MKATDLSACVFLLWVMGTPCGAESATPARGSAADSASTPDQPVLISVRVEGTNLVAVAQVPAGITVVTLEGRTRLGAGAWVPRAVVNVDGAGGEATFRVQLSSDLELLRVRADVRAALPSAFYRGTNQFGGAVSSYDPAASNKLSPGGTVDATGAAAAPTRDVVESDIWKISGSTLYFFNQYRGLQVVDLANPDAPAIRGTFDLPAAGEQMYLIDTNYTVLLVHGCGWGGNDNGNDVLIIDVTGTNLNAVASLPVDGSILESRLVGTALYVASQVYRPIAGTTNNSWEWGTMVSSFDLSTPTQPVARQQLWYPSTYGTVVTATDRFFFLATQGNNNWWQSIIQVIDVSAADGTMISRAKLPAAGQVTDKFKMNVTGDGTNAVFTVISEAWSDVARWTPTLQTFSLADPDAPQKLGYLTFTSGEQLHATRFDGKRVYVVTFKQIDPLWVVDLSDPTRPKVAGKVEVPGWSTYIDPLGDRLVTIGVQITNNWHVAVSLYDAGNPTNISLLSQVPLGDNYSWSEANYDEKAFGVFPDAGLILVPYQGYYTNGWASAVQLIDLGTNSLALRGVIQHQFTPRRAAPIGTNRIVSISGQELLSVDATDRDHPVTRADLELAWPVDRLFLEGDYVVEIGDETGWGSQSGPVLHVALAANPDQALKEYGLTNIPVLGATVQNHRLYLVQGLIGWYGPPMPDATGQTNSATVTNPPNFFLSIFDLQNLPSVSLLGQASVTTDQMGWNNSWQPVWVKPGLLVWSGGQGFWILPMMGAVGIKGGVATATGGGVSSAPDVSANSVTAGGGAFWRWPWWGWGGNGGRLLAFDVANAAAPKFLSELDLTTNNWWSFSAPFTTNGLVYLSHAFSETIVVGTNYVVSTTNIIKPDPNQPPSPSGGTLVTNAQPIFNWVQRFDLDVVDYADPVNPTVRPPVNIPGTLQGISAAGALLYTTGQHWTTNGVTDWTEWLDASAYDGVSAHLVTSLLLSTNWPHPVLVQGTNIFIGHAANSTNVSDELQIWTLLDSGAFGKVSTTPLKASANVLANFGTLLAVQENDSQIALFGTADPARLLSVGGIKPSGCLWYNLGAADGRIDRGLWLPLGAYGVEKITVTTSP